MSDDVAYGVAQYGFGYVDGTHVGVSLSGLYEEPVADELDEVVIDIDGGHEYLTGARVDPRGSHGVAYVDGSVAYAVVLDVVRVELRVVGREVTGDDGSLQSTFFLEHLAPLVDGLHDVGTPLGGERRVDIEDDGLRYLDHLAALPGSSITGLQVPAVGIVDGHGRGRGIAQLFATGEEVADAVVSHARPVRLLLEQHDGAGHLCCKGLVLQHRGAVAGQGEGIGKGRLDRDIVGKGLDAIQERAVGLETLRTGIAGGVRGVLVEG